MPPTLPVIVSERHGVFLKRTYNLSVTRHSHRIWMTTGFSYLSQRGRRQDSRRVLG